MFPLNVRQSANVQISETGPTPQRASRSAAWLVQVAAVALSLGAIAIAQARAEPACLNTTRINNTKVVDARTIDFRMQGGSVYRSVMTTPCTGLLFFGFAYRTPINEICAHQAIRVLRSGEMCFLGPFAKLPAPPAAPASGP